MGSDAVAFFASKSFRCFLASWLTTSSTTCCCCASLWWWLAQCQHGLGRCQFCHGSFFISSSSNIIMVLFFHNRVSSNRQSRIHGCHCGRNVVCIKILLCCLGYGGSGGYGCCCGGGKEQWWRHGPFCVRRHSSSTAAARGWHGSGYSSLGYRKGIRKGGRKRGGSCRWSDMRGNNVGTAPECFSRHLQWRHAATKRQGPSCTYYFLHYSQIQDEFLACPVERRPYYCLAHLTTTTTWSTTTTKWGDQKMTVKPLLTA